MIFYNIQKNHTIYLFLNGNLVHVIQFLGMGADKMITMILQNLIVPPLKGKAIN